MIKLQQNSVNGEIPSLDDIVNALDIGKSEVDEQSVIGTELDLHDASQFLANRDLEITRRVSVIQNFYHQVTNPRSEGAQQSA